MQAFRENENPELTTEFEQIKAEREQARQNRTSSPEVQEAYQDYRSAYWTYRDAYLDLLDHDSRAHNLKYQEAIATYRQAHANYQEVLQGPSVSQPTESEPPLDSMEPTPLESTPVVTDDAIWIGFDASEN